MEQAPSATQSESLPVEPSAPIANKVRLQFRGTMRRAMIAAFVLFVLSVLSALFGIGRGLPFLGALMSWTLLISFITICLAPFLAMIRFPAAKSLSAHDNAVLVTRFGKTHHIPANKIKEGIIVEQRFGKQFIPLERIQKVTTSDSEVLLDLVDGTQFRARARNLSDVTQAMVTERVNEALAVRAKQSAELNALAALGRGQRDGLAWREAMSGLLDKNRGYRVAPLTRDQVISVLSDPGAPADRRLGAAIALAKSGDQEAPTRIRIAAGASANQKVRIALESIAAGEIDNVAIDEAGEEEVARREATS